MIVDPVREIVAWWADAATGINAQLANVPRDPDEPAPSPIDAIYCEMDVPWAARLDMPDDVLANADGSARAVLIVGIHPGAEGGAGAEVRAHLLPEFDAQDPAIVPVLAQYFRRYVQQGDAATDYALQARNARQVLRTAGRVFAQHFQSSQSCIVRNGCVLSLPHPSSGAGGAVFNHRLVQPTAGLIADAAVFPIRVEDRWLLDVM